MASVNKVILSFMYHDERRSIPDIASALGVPYSRARKLLKDAGIALRSRADGVRAASHKLGKHLAGKTRVFSEQWRANISAGRKASTVFSGLTVKPSGYVEVTRGKNKGRSLHRVIMEKKLGRQLSRDEVVHHKDECRSNNNESNLEVMTRAEHTSHHRKEAANGKR